MRTIKFRAWDKKEKVMTEITLNKIARYFDGGASFISTENYRFPDENEWNERLELMQFTGLLDKNGKEIYFDDLVRMGGEMGTIRQVIFWRGSIVAKAKDDDYLPVYEWLDKLEVIGNIYSNPELLTPTL
jgi:uncharacterized phage protein (TIGR01671 family)